MKDIQNAKLLGKAIGFKAHCHSFCFPGCHPHHYTLRRINP
ncbi:MAG: hypothetical protein VSS75_012715 [Candidatus Parabeggiatoa sp.]|nr:hypothetical protein [Candidatus Parabeggiatoa sp.]